MKKLLFAVCALAAISLLAPDAGYAQWENRIGIYTTDTAGAANLATTPIGVPTSLYFVVSNPLYPDNSGPLPAVDAFEFKVSIVPDSGFFVLAQNKPAGTVDVGAGAVGGTFDYNAGWPAELPVVGGMVKIMDWSMMFLSAGPYRFYMGPPNTASVAGSMAVNYTDTSENAYLVACLPSSGATDKPVFVMGGDFDPDPVGVEASTFGNVKALFR